jgi:hypothetical protein
VLNLYVGRAIIVLIVGSILSIVAVKYIENDLASSVPMTTPARAATDY